MTAGSDALRALIQVGTGAREHRYVGDCPDDEAPDSRDPSCAACDALVAAEDYLAAAREHLPAVHTFRIWETTTHDGRPAHMGTTPLPAEDLSARAASSDKSHPAGAPHTVRWREVTRHVDVTTHYGPWQTPDATPAEAAS